MNCGIVNHAFANFRPTRLELGLHQRDHVGRMAEQGRHDRQYVAKGNERDIDDDEVNGTGHIRWCQMAGVEPFDYHHARVIAQLPVDLAMTDVERHNPTGSALEQNVCEPARRRADIETFATVDVHVKGVECVREFEAPATNVGMVRLQQSDDRVILHRRAGLVDGAAGNDHLSSQNQGARAFA